MGRKGWPRWPGVLVAVLACNIQNFDERQRKCHDSSGIHNQAYYAVVIIRRPYESGLSPCAFVLYPVYCQHLKRTPWPGRKSCLPANNAFLLVELLSFLLTPGGVGQFAIVLMVLKRSQTGGP